MTDAHGESPTLSALRRRSPGGWLAALTIVLFAANLRITIGSLGVLLDPISQTLRMPGWAAGVLTTLPLIAFAVLGLLSARLVRRIGLHRTAVLALVVMAVALAARAIAANTWTFLALSAIALAAVAVGNVVLPPLVKANFPHRLALMSSLYGAAIMAGVTVASALTVPLSAALGSWRAGLGAWAGVALLAAIPWLFFATPERSAPEQLDGPSRSMLRTPTMWALAGCFGLQSAHAYAQFGWYPLILTDAGLGAERAGVMLSLITGVGIPLTLALPLLMSWFGDGIGLPVIFGVATSVGWAGILIAPTTLTWLWSVSLGIGGVTFTWLLTMISRKAADVDVASRLSSATQGIGYLIAGSGPLMLGIVHSLTGSWMVPIAVMLVASLTIPATGIAVVRSKMVV